jgi:hypothetical protein
MRHEHLLSLFWTFSSEMGLSLSVEETPSLDEAGRLTSVTFIKRSSKKPLVALPRGLDVY